jgi:hypothetical protein
MDNREMNITSKWSWIEGKVDTSAEYIELRYGSIESGTYDDWIPVAYVSSPQGQIFFVQFLIEPLDEAKKIALETAKTELNFYLVEKEEPDPWSYAQYHCGTTSNVYSDIHWSFFPKNTEHDGSSPTKAIVVSSVKEEYEWLRFHCYGFQSETQTLQKIDGKPYDVLTLCNDEGVKRIVYFDISKFYKTG